VDVVSRSVWSHSGFCTRDPRISPPSFLRNRAEQPPPISVCTCFRLPAQLCSLPCPSYFARRSVRNLFANSNPVLISRQAVLDHGCPGMASPEAGAFVVFSEHGAGVWREADLPAASSSASFLSGADRGALGPLQHGASSRESVKSKTRHILLTSCVVLSVSVHLSMSHLLSAGRGLEIRLHFSRVSAETSGRCARPFERRTAGHLLSWTQPGHLLIVGRRGGARPVARPGG